MGAVVEGIRRTTRSTSWQQSGLVDPGLMRSVRVILQELRRATGNASLGLPFEFGHLPPGLGSNPEGVIHVAMNPAWFDPSAVAPAPVVLDAGRAFRSILIADGDIVLTSAEDCLILATGAVEVSYPTRCVVIAGRLIRASHDTASVLLAGSRLSVSHSHRPERPPIRPAIYSAPELVSVGHAAGTILLNCPISEHVPPVLVPPARLAGAGLRRRRPPCRASRLARSDHARPGLVEPSRQRLRPACEGRRPADPRR